MPKDVATVKFGVDVPVALYRAYDIHGQLLYVGISMRPDERMAQHRNRARWRDQIAYVATKWFPDALGASNAELAAIRPEKPVHNQAGVATPYFPHPFLC